MKGLAPWIAGLAAIVAAPRTTALYLAIDGGTDASWVDILVATATSLALTGGQIYLADHLARNEGNRGWLGFFWVGDMIVLTFIGTVAFLVRVESKIEKATSSEWMGDHPVTVALALAMAAGPELIAAGCTVGHAGGATAEGTLKTLKAEHDDRLDQIAGERNDAQGRVDHLEEAARDAADRPTGLPALAQLLSELTPVEVAIAISQAPTGLLAKVISQVPDAALPQVEPGILPRALPGSTSGPTSGATSGSYLGLPQVATSGKRPKCEVEKRGAGYFATCRNCGKTMDRKATERLARSAEAGHQRACKKKHGEVQ